MKWALINRYFSQPGGRIQYIDHPKLEPHNQPSLVMCNRSEITLVYV